MSDSSLGSEAPARPVRKARLRSGAWWMRFFGLVILAAALVSFALLAVIPDVHVLRELNFVSVAFGPFLGSALFLTPWAAAASEPGPSGYRRSVFARTFCVGMVSIIMLVVGFAAAITLLFP